MHAIEDKMKEGKESESVKYFSYLYREKDEGLEHAEALMGRHVERWDWMDVKNGFEKSLGGNLATVWRMWGQIPDDSNRKEIWKVNKDPRVVWRKKGMDLMEKKWKILLEGIKNDSLR